MSRLALKLKTLALLFSIPFLFNAGCSDALTDPPGTQGQFKIAFNSFRNGHMVISTMNADGTNQIQLTSDTTDASYPEWSPDGKKIIYLAGDKDVYTMNADGTSQTFLADANGDDWDERPIWSPDGKHILFMGSGGGYYVMNADGSDQKILSVGRHPGFSGDGKKIAFVDESHSGPTPTDQIFIVNADGTNIQQLTQDTGRDNKGFPVWSPDGKKIAFQSDRYGSNEIYTINVDGTNQSRLTTGSGENPYWSPDGTRIAFVGSDSLVYVMNQDGSNQQKVASSPPDDSIFPSILSPFPSWSPDGTKILFISGQSGVSISIYSMNPDGTNQQKLTLGGLDIYPAWSLVRLP